MANKMVMMILIINLALIMGMATSSSAQLSINFYQKTCPKLLTTVRSVVKSAISKERRIGASLLRLHFHDCFVNGCDGSVLLEDTPSFTGEQTAPANNNSLRGFNVIDKIKSKVEKLCPHVASCADILTLASRDSVVLLGGPSWDVKLGRRDSKTASFAEANRTGVLPSPFSSLSELIKSFKDQGLSATDMVALSGGHTIGDARCTTFRRRIYEESNIESEFAKRRQKECPRTQNSGDNNLAPLDVQTPKAFDNKYFQNLLQKKGLLHSDQVLFNGGSTDSLVKKYSTNNKAFDRDFVKAMIKMGDIKPLTGSKGEIRKKCGKPN